MFKKKRALVTGNLGLIGGATTKRLLAMGYHVTGIDNNARAKYFDGVLVRPLFSDKNLEQISADISMITQELLDNASHYDVIVHAAAQPSHALADENPDLDFRVNVLGTHNILEIARRSKNCTFIYLSTTKVFSDSINGSCTETDSRYTNENLINEDTALEGTHGIFGAHKLAADVIVQEYSRIYEMNTIVFRPGCITGKAHQGTREHGFLSYLAKCIRDGDKYYIEGDGKQVRDQLHVDDLVDAFVEVIKKPESGVYVIGGGADNSLSLVEAIRMIELQLGKKAKLGKSNRRVADHLYNVHDNSKFTKNYPSWKIKKTLINIIEELTS